MGCRWLCLCALLACSGGGGISLRVDLRTDFVPGIEFAEVRTSIEDRSETLTVSQMDELFEAGRVATFDGLPRGDHVINVALHAANGALLAERSIRLNLQNDFGVTVLLTRDCRGVMCPGAGDSPSALSCLGGQCVPLECVDPTTPECPDAECTVDTDCPAQSSCSVARCETGVCLYMRDDSLCAADEYCEPEGGCKFVPTVVDSGVGVDASVDTGVDAGGVLQFVDISPQAGPPSGGTPIRLTLLGDLTGLEVAVGGRACTPVDSVMICPVPAGSIGQVDVVARNMLGETSAMPGGFTYFTPGVYQEGTSQNDRSSGIAIDSGGHLYVSGATTGNLDGPNEGDWDAVLLKYDVDGTLAWIRTLGTSGFDYSRDVVVGADDTIYVAGYSDGDIDGVGGVAGGMDVYVAAYDTDGNLRWVTQTGSDQDDECWDLGVDSAGNTFLAGRTQGVVDGASQGMQDAVLWRFDAAGNETWARQFGTSVDDLGHSVAVDPAGHAFLVGYTMGAIEGSNQGAMDMFIARYRADGSRDWIRQRGSGGVDQAHDVIIGAGGDLYVSGFTTSGLDGQTFLGGEDVFVMRYAPDGTWHWTRQWGSAANESTWTISEGAQGNLYVAGVTTGAFDGETNAGGDDYFLSKLTPAGDRLWTRIRGTAGEDSPSACANDSAYSELTYVSIVTDGDLGGGGGRGGEDIAVTKFDAAGNEL